MVGEDFLPLPSPIMNRAKGMSEKWTKNHFRLALNICLDTLGLLPHIIATLKISYLIRNCLQFFKKNLPQCLQFAVVFFIKPNKLFVAI